MALMLNVNGPEAIGDPVKVPLALRVKPVGRVPLTRLNVYGPLPPVAVTTGV